MINKDKFLKDEVSIKEFAIELTKQICRWDELSYEKDIIEEEIVNFLNEQVKPTLTEDERVILRNVDKDLKTISRYDNGLFLHFAKQGKMYFYMYNHLFQFIKERRRI